MTILSSSIILCAEGCPEELKAARNELWNFVGEVKDVGRSYYYATCKKCNRREMREYIKNVVKPKPLLIIRLKGYHFIIEDMLGVTIYWGRCEECRTIYWMRQGPPFEYLRSYVGV